MSVYRTWLNLSAFERDCFDACCHLSYDPNETPTHDRIGSVLCERYERGHTSDEVESALTELLHRSLIAHNQPKSDTLGFTLTKEGRAVLVHRYQQLASLTVHDRTADMEVWK